MLRKSLLAIVLLATASFAQTTQTKWIEIGQRNDVSYEVSSKLDKRGDATFGLTRNVGLAGEYKGYSRILLWEVDCSSGRARLLAGRSYSPTNVLLGEAAYADVAFIEFLPGSAGYAAVVVWCGEVKSPPKKAKALPTEG